MRPAPGPTAEARAYAVAPGGDLKATAIKYNPGLLPPDILERTFAARQHELADLVERVRQNCQRESAQHCLIIGPRGSGKTTLLHLLGIRVRQDADLAATWMPVLFSEYEPSIYVFGDLMVTILQRVPPLSAEAEGLRAEALERAQADRDNAASLALDGIEAIGAALERRFLLLVDNLDQVFEQATAGDEAATARLRAVLQHSPLFMLVGTSTAVFEELIDYGRPLYQFFAPIHLEPLRFAQVLELLRRRAAVDGNPMFRRMSRDLKRKVRVVTEVAGGNPRLVVALYEVLTGEPLLPEMETLWRLLDELTPYYKGRLEALPPQQRRILDVVVRAAAGAGASEVAQSTGFRPNLVAAQLGRLRAAGWLRLRRGRDKRSSRYVVADRLFHYWYRMRYEPGQRQQLGLLVSFYRDLYGAEELKAIHVDLLARLESAAGAPSHVGGLLDNSAVLDISARLRAIQEVALSGSEADEACERLVIALIQAGELHEAETVAAPVRATAPMLWSWLQAEIGIAFAERLPPARESLEEAVRLFREGRSTCSEGSLEFAACLANEGKTHRMLADLGAEARANLEEAAHLYGQARGIYPEGSMDSATCLANEASVRARLAGLGVEPRAYLEEAVCLFAEARAGLPDGTPDVAACLIGEGTAREGLADLGVSARANLEEAVRLYVKAKTVLPVGSAESARCLTNEGDARRMLADLGVETLANLGEALRLYVEARAILPEGSPHYAACLATAGLALGKLGELGVSARANLEEAVCLFAEARAGFTEGSHNYAACFINEGIARLILARLGVEARANLRQAICLHRRARAILPLGSPELGHCLTNEARASLRLADLDASGMSAEAQAAFLAVLEALGEDERRPLWFAYLRRAILSGMDRVAFEALVDRVAERLSEPAEVLDLFRRAYRLRHDGDSTALEGLSEDLRRAVEALIAEELDEAEGDEAEDDDEADTEPPQV
ncbi:MAG: AAA family ATPase [Anaerolineae bacterium]